ncbi:1-acyl-sn-glycerol-3-phosphate acyltransferase [Pseudooceanicola sp. 216_PA32_1]|uniref:1-acyl-sn-glycerol-3-phosphate acyltransferase n=1 Tax=Pseudooceanicola pacificus TaxID=2676438 RepID=A0A844W3R7_9RHOB|nr:lysophospholipid acyltransferase family protein [Pseudooceanicola pacificus]MWB77461.1 1-acyl-sn-glycerol-3-phosphate acyltransferase [Pseudooceanicola pacificus]
MQAWTSGDEPQPARPGLAGRIRFWARALPAGAMIFGGLGLLLVLRLFERLFCGQQRPVTGRLVQLVCKGFYRIIGMEFRVTGQPMPEGGAVVANHASWLDIFTLNAAQRIYFVSKAEVAGWFGIGWLARATGTIFINRDRREARSQTEVFRERLSLGHRLLFFPEGTSTDGMRVLPFKTTLFAAFFEPALRQTLFVQPVTVVYHAPEGEDPRFYGWWGDMSFGAALVKALSQAPQGRVEVIWHPPLRVADFADRKALAARAEAVVRGGMPAERRIT